MKKEKTQEKINIGKRFKGISVRHDTTVPLKLQKGITLIALVITIIVLLILAGVTLSIVFNGGIINKSQTAVDKYTEEQAKEKLSLALFEYKMDKVTKKEGTDLQTTLSKLGPVIEAEDTNYYEVEIDGYLFWVHKETLEIISKGPSNPVPPTKIEFTETTDEAYVGEGKNFNLKLKLEPQNANPKFLKWSVSDESVATIQNGVLTGLKEGTVVVTVTSTEDASIIATCTVTVKPIELTGITLNKTSTTIGMGKTETLEVTYTPVNATYKDIVWSTSDDTIATVENGTVTGIKAGTATITATSAKYSNIYFECIVNIEEIVLISSTDDLKQFRNNVNNGDKYNGKKVTLTTNLDLNNEEWEAIGTKTNYFAGSFDGQGHTISGLYINKPNDDYQGLFGYINGNEDNKSKIENLAVENANINGKQNIAGIAGWASNTMINCCSISGNIISNETKNDYNSGGIVGILDNGTISNCYNRATINVTTATTNTMASVGGIVGYCIYGNTINNVVINCYNAGSVTGGNNVGGICGEGRLKIINCYNVEKVKAIKDYAGGIVGKIYCEEANNCYNSAKISGNSFIGSIFSSVSSSTSTSNIKNCVYLTGTAEYGIYESAYRDLAQSSDTLPSILSVINGDNAFVEDKNNINGGYPILSFQQ